MNCSLKSALVSAACFLVACAFACRLLLTNAVFTFLILFFCCLSACVHLFRSKNRSERHCGACAALLGCSFSWGVYLCSRTTIGQPSCFGIYLCLLSIFHVGEFLMIAMCSGDEVTVDSFLLNHSLEYWAAAVFSWLEYCVELFVWPHLKRILLLIYPGLILAIVGEVLRKGAMVNAGVSFSHVMRFYKKPDHTLVTTGLYSLCRHPAYLGWLLWSVGTQMVLVNPVCTVLYAVVSWKFLADRVVHEELLLVQFFGKNYISYRDKVLSGIPFVR